MNIVGIVNSKEEAKEIKNIAKAALIGNWAQNLPK